MISRWLRSGSVISAAHVLLLSTFLGVYLLIGVSGRSNSPYVSLAILPLLLSIAATNFQFALVIGIAFALGMTWMGGAPIPSELDIARGLATAGIAVCGAVISRAISRERRSLFEALAQKDALLDASRIISASDDLETAVDSALRILPKLVPEFRCAAIFLEDDSDGNMRLYDVIGCDRDDLAFKSFDAKDADSRWRSTDPAPLYVPDVNALHSAPVAMLDSRARSVLCLSLQSPRAFTTSVGMLYISSGRPNAFSNGQIKLLQEFADIVGFPLQKVRLQEGLQNLAFTDALTGLANYRYFRAELEEEVKRASRYKHPLSLIMLDLDLFKSVNDRYGHQVGDSALQWLAELIRQNVREADFPTRYGGEEFAVICSEAGIQDAAVVAERIRAAVQQEQFRLESGEGISLTVSAGVASYPTNGANDTDLIRAADEALYDAKRTGRNRIVTFGPSPQRRSA